MYTQEATYNCSFHSDSGNSTITLFWNVYESKDCTLQQNQVLCNLLHFLVFLKQFHFVSIHNCFSNANFVYSTNLINFCTHFENI